MRVALYVDSEAYGGVLTYVMELSSALRKAGAEVAILTHEAHGTVAEAIVAELEGHGDVCLKLPRETNVGVDARILAHAIQEIKADIFIPNYRIMPHAAAAICSRQTAVRSIGVCHNNHVSAYGLLDQYESCLSRFVCASTTTAAHLTAMLPWRAADIATIPHGVSISSQPSAKFDGGILRLIYHGRLVEEQKRVSLLLEIARRLSDREVPYHLTLVGDGPDVEQYRRTVDRLSLNGRISFHGSESWAKLGPRLAASHVAVLVSEYEGFCLSLAEAMGAGLPAIAFHCGGVIEQFLVDESTGLLVQGNDIDAFVSSVARLQADANLWSRMSRQARKSIQEKHSWANAVDAYIPLLEEALRDPSVRRWAPGRPTWMKTGRSMRSIVERLGKEFGVWR